jgi:hypothetical protein
MSGNQTETIAMFRAGQKVCCIRDDEFEKLNRRGDIYTINSIASYGGER